MPSRPEFGLSSSRFNGQKGFKKNFASTSFNKYGLPSKSTTTPSNIDQRFEDARIQEDIEYRFGFERYQEGPERLGWLLNMHTTTVLDSEWPSGRSAVEFYFINDNGETFKATKVYNPYFYIGCKPGTESEVEDYLHRRFEGLIEKLKRVKKEDLKQPNHLVGHTRTFIQLSFRNIKDLMNVRKVLLPAVQKNKAKLDAVDTYAEMIKYEYDDIYSAAMSSRRNPDEVLENVIDIREYDIPFHIRTAIDLDIRVGLWYDVKAQEDGTITLTRRTDLVHRPEPIILAFDIETTKLPLKFPDANIDQIMMISYMIDGRGYLITNREIVSQDIEDFEYTPKPEFEGPFTIFNEANEEAVLRRFFEHIQEAKPTIYVTYNGDFFDWPFVEGRAKAHGINMYHEIGVYKDDEDEYKCKHASHMDAFRWVQRDSYLPNGSQGLKAVTTIKLGYNPLELDPEDMTRFASEQPQVLAQYSVSDAVATYYLYMKYVHPFIFSLCNIIPLIPDEVLRKGTGTLCEQLLMVEAYRANVIIPNKHVDDPISFYDGHLLESETYVGGHVEALEAGVFRSDINADFKVDPSAAQELIDQLDDALKFTITVEEKKKLEDITNYDEVKQAIIEKLEDLKARPIRQEAPLIYHLDVAAMYPNIILTNRLQPDAMIDDSMCATCDFNKPDKNCDRRMKWLWRGEFTPAKRNEYKMIENQLSQETFPAKYPDQPPRPWHALSDTEKSTLLRARLKDYSRKVYNRVKETKTIERESIICQRENPFYIETVRAFRDRRYEYKGLHKTWKGKLDEAVKDGSATKIGEAKNMIVLYDSLQLAHKCILNSFYGYVMRPAARWHSLEMAGIVCLTGSNIIQMARQLVERIGRPLELDTDGIWCILPKTFPETFSFTLKNGKSLRIYYPCTMLNHLVHAQFTNKQYQHLVNPKTYEYSVSEENSIFFEIDGPYRAMVLPSSTEEDKLLKKRYAVFNMDGSLAELKGFEVKRRGELKLIKIFQTEIFKVFLEGNTLEECYAAVAKVANRWLDVLYSKAADITDEELFELIAENRNMSKTLAQYDGQKSTSISTAKRLAEFLGDQMVKDKGLACNFIISARPYGLPVSERAVPVAIFQSEENVKKHYLRKWLGDNSLDSFEIRDVLDWDYYLDRFGSVIQKLITIPAAMQKIHNPVPRVRHPDWLFKRVAARNDKYRQHKITDIFSRTNKPLLEDNMEVDDIEELNVSHTEANGLLPKIAKVTRKRKRQNDESGEFDINAPLPEEDRPENMPNWEEDYPAWLEFQKRKWKRQRMIRVYRREHLGSTLSTKQVMDGVGGYFRRQTGSLVTSLWEIIQIAETDIPGEFKMWVMVQGQLYNIRLTIPRTFYLNCKEGNPEVVKEQNPACELVKSSRTLPRSHPSLNLFQVTMPENIYQAEVNKFSNIFNHPSTDAVYETQVPLIVRAVLQLGSICQYNKTSDTASRRMDDQFNLLELKERTDLTKSYMSDPKAFHFLYLFHGHSDSRHFFALIGSTLAVSQIFVVGLNKNNHQMPNVARIYRERYEAMLEKGNIDDTITVPETMEFETSYHSSEKHALNAINKALSNYQNAKKGKTVIAINSPRSSAYLIQHARLITEFPYVRIPALQQDSKFDALNWLQPMLKRVFKYYMELGTWVNERLCQARYANVPFCNIPEDPYTFMADIMFARTLIQSDMIIWWSTAKMPDLGGREEDENISITSEVINPELNFPGTYETVCVDLDLSKLCLNTLMIAPSINELEGTAGHTSFDNVSHTLDDYANGAIITSSSFGEGMISSKTFSMLRAIVQIWFNTYVSNGSGIAEHMVDSLHRWLLSPNSCMHDPSLYGLVHSLMKKVFMQLIAELKRLGAKIVFANFHRILLTTTKETEESAAAFFEYLHRTIEGKQVFEILELKKQAFWDVLLWMDERNFAGVLVGNYMDDVPAITKQWNIEEHLPNGAREKFGHYTSLYIYMLTRSKTQFPREITIQEEETDEPANDDRAKNLQRYVEGDLSRKIVRWISKFAANHPTDSNNPALEFIKLITGVLSLDNRIEEPVLLLKRDALSAVSSISDFALQVQFTRPSEFYKLTEVICTYCNYTTDLDFCRDPELMPQGGKVRAWRCKGCKSEYDKHLIEERMIIQVQKWLASYQLQDLSCNRCHTVKAENLARQCSRCGSEYALTQSRSELERKIRIFKTVAKEQQLLALEDVIDWCLATL
ncbi:Putative DNA polymerase [Rhizopus microsporus]|nr:Putative DNA polymerase [Rhizopus microsporus]